MKFFITGATGFIGSNLCAELLKRGHEVAAVYRHRKELRVSAIKQPNWVHIENQEHSGTLLRNSDVFIHLASAGVNPDQEDWNSCFQCNVNWSLTLWNQAIRCGMDQFIICGSCAEFGRTADQISPTPADAPLAPKGPYATSKACASVAAIGLALEKNLKMQIARPFHVYGPGESSHRLWPSLVRAAEAGEDLDLSPGDQIRDFIHVNDVCSRLIEMSLEFPQAGTVRLQNIGTGRPQSLADFASRHWELLKATGKIRYGAIPYRKNEIMKMVADLNPRILN